MNRKEAVHYISLLLGGTLAGVNSFLTGCKSSDKQMLSDNDTAYLDEIAETILPETNTPGAKAAKTGSFMLLMVNDCYSEKEQTIFRDGMKKINEQSKAKFGKEFLSITAQQRHELLQQIDAEQRQYMKNKKEDEPVHYFRMMKELTLLGYFTSEPGMTKAKRYMPLPGKYIGCVPYAKGEKAIVWTNFEYLLFDYSNENNKTSGIFLNARVYCGMLFDCESKTILFTITKEKLSFYNEKLQWIAEPGEFDLMIGSSSGDIRLKDSFELVR